MLAAPLRSLTIRAPALSALAAAALATACVDDAAAPPKVVLSGNAYTFNTPDPVVGATIGIAEEPGLTTTSAADGSWSLEVDGDREVTPYVTDSRFVTMHLQTFALTDADLEHVNFQMVNHGVWDLLAQVLAITPDPAKCQIASTVSEKAIQAMTYDEFRAHGAHGVAGATVTVTPETTPVVYFNKDVIPDRSLTESSRDGGVVWTNVDPGRYTIHASHPDKQFEDIVVECAAGRFVNANPPHGLREL